MSRERRIYSILVFTVLFTFGASLSPSDIFRSIGKFIYENGKMVYMEPEDVRDRMLNTYDFIIVGAGTAGSVLANRLSQVPEWKILLIEAGGNENFIMDIPLLATGLQLTSANWNYKTEPQPSGCLGHINQQCNWPRGKVMGGSSVLHSMIHTRGHREDYNRIAQLGNPGWDYESVFPYFKKFEKMDISPLDLDTKYHSTDGEMNINYAEWQTPLAQAFLDAGEEIGGKVLDYNGKNMIGYSKIQFTLRNGTRLSASRAFLHRIRKRKNLHVLKRTTISKILIDPKTKTAYGVEYETDNAYQQIYARKEVIISGGTINSAQLLMLSGIGPKSHLEKLGIPVIKHAKVGYNLQDHIAPGGIIFVINETVSIRSERIYSHPEYFWEFMHSHRGPLSAPTGTEAIAFLNTSDPTNSLSSYPDLELLFVAGSVVSDALFKSAFAIDDEIFREVYKPIATKDTWMVFPMVLLPKSRGRVMLRDNNWRSKPLIYANYFADPYDQEVALRGIRMVQKLSRTKAFQRYGSKQHDIPMPNCRGYKFDSDDYWRCAMKTITQTIYHLTGTCKMGPAHDSEAVVNPRLQVYGINNLRVIDASIFPFVPAAHTNAPTLMVAEKGADLIKEDWNITLQ